MRRRPPMWRMAAPGIIRQPYLDADGFHNILAIGPDHRELHRLRVFTADEELEVATMLRRMLAEQFPHLKEGAL